MNVFKGNAHARLQVGGATQLVVFYWRSDAAGEVEVSFDLELDGFLTALVTRPSETEAPTDDYDLSILDEWSFDVLDNFGQDRDAVIQEAAGLDIEFGSRRPVRTRTLRLVVQNAGANKMGIAQLYGSGVWRNNEPDARDLPIAFEAR